MGFLRIDHNSGLKSAHIKSVIKLAAMVQHTLLCVWSQMGFTWIYCNFYIVEHTFRAPMIYIWLLSGYITNAYVRKYNELDTLIISTIYSSRSSLILLVLQHFIIIFLQLLFGAKLHFVSAQHFM